MNSSLYIGATGMKGLAEGMHVTTNNIANISTIGFKQQDILFSDVLYQTQGSMGNWWNAQEESRVAIGQVGMGLQIEAVRTSFLQGALETTNTMTDLAINGKGFFQISDGNSVFYTRAGDFRADKEGVWRTPSGYALNGFKLDENGNPGELMPVKVDTFATMPPKSTSSIEMTVNLGNDQNMTADSENPFFGLLENYDARQEDALGSGAYTTSQSMTVYDQNGEARKVTAYFDGVPQTVASGKKYSEFLIAETPKIYDEAGKLVTHERGDGLLMSGVLEFDGAGNLVNISAFTPSVAGSQKLEDWTAAKLENGNPVFNLDGAEMSINLGLSAGEGWSNVPTNAAQIGKDNGSLPQMAGAAASANPSTAYHSASVPSSYSQNGYSEGILSNVSITSDGIVTGSFSNGQIQDLWEIPVCRFTSEDGLRREGNNMFTATAEAGVMEMGMAGTENYGNVLAYNIENSNVDLAKEMVNMIINQRGFQSNSKVVTTADQMLQKAVELKR